MGVDRIANVVGRRGIARCASSLALVVWAGPMATAQDAGPAQEPGGFADASAATCPRAPPR